MMSSLGWLIYFVGLSETVSNAEGFVIALLFLMSIGITVVRLIVLFDQNEKTKEHTFPEAERARYGKSLFRWSMVIYVGFFISVLIQFVIPSKQTAIFIAASEVSQRVLQSEQAKAVGQKFTGVLDPSVDLLTTWIKKEQTQQQYQLDDLVHAHDVKDRDRR